MKTYAAALVAALSLAPLAAAPAAAPAAADGGSCYWRNVTLVAGPGAGVVTGTPGDDVVLVTGSGVTLNTLEGDDRVCVSGALDVTVDSGPGRDIVVLTDTGDAAPTGSVEGGDDGDELVLYSNSAVDADLQQDRVQFYGTTNQAPTAISVHGFRDLRLAAPGVSATGDRRDNRIVMSGCPGTAFASGRQGDDRIRLTSGPLTCPGTAKAVFSGGPGDDRLYGGSRNDLLRGGPGRDLADGGPGFDRCLTSEKVRDCER